MADLIDSASSELQQAGSQVTRAGVRTGVTIASSATRVSARVAARGVQGTVRGVLSLLEAVRSATASRSGEVKLREFAQRVDGKREVLPISDAEVSRQFTRELRRYGVLFSVERMPDGSRAFHVQGKDAALIEHALTRACNTVDERIAQQRPTLADPGLTAEPGTRVLELDDQQKTALVDALRQAGQLEAATIDEIDRTGEVVLTSDNVNAMTAAGATTDELDTVVAEERAALTSDDALAGIEQEQSAIVDAPVLQDSNPWQGTEVTPERAWSTQEIAEASQGVGINTTLSLDNPERDAYTAATGKYINGNGWQDLGSTDQLSFNPQVGTDGTTQAFGPAGLEPGAPAQNSLELADIPGTDRTAVQYIGKHDGMRDSYGRPGVVVTMRFELPRDAATALRDQALQNPEAAYQVLQENARSLGLPDRVMLEPTQSRHPSQLPLEIHDVRASQQPVQALSTAAPAVALEVQPPAVVEKPEVSLALNASESHMLQGGLRNTAASVHAHTPAAADQLNALADKVQATGQVELTPQNVRILAPILDARTPETLQWVADAVQQESQRLEAQTLDAPELAPAVTGEQESHSEHEVETQHTAQDAAGQPVDDGPDLRAEQSAQRSDLSPREATRDRVAKKVDQKVTQAKQQRLAARPTSRGPRGASVQDPNSHGHFDPRTSGRK